MSMSLAHQIETFNVPNSTPHRRSRLFIGSDVFGKPETRAAFEVDVVPVLVQYLETKNSCATDIG